MNDVQAKKFKLPSIFGQKSTEPTSFMATEASSVATARPTKFTNLSEMANAHFSTNKLVNGIQKMNLSENINIPKSSKFTIPKLSGGSSSVSPSSGGESLTPHEMSLKKIMDEKLKRLHISTTNDTENTAMNTDIEHLSAMSVENQQLSIDLASALNGPNFSISSIIAPIKPTAESIDFKFIDCDITEESSSHPFISQDCCLNISNILDKHFDTRTKCTTAFGKILCSRYKRKKQSVIQNVHHGFVNKYQIKPFRFDIINKPTTKYSKST